MEEKKTLCIDCGKTFDNFKEQREHARICDTFIPLGEIKQKLKRMDEEGKLLRGGRDS